MARQYIYMNKSENKVLWDSPVKVLSGDLSAVNSFISFKPKFSNGSLWDRFCNLFSGLVMVEVNIEEAFTQDYFKGTGYSYVWLLHEETGLVYRVWATRKEGRYNSYMTENGVFIKSYTTFKHFDFNCFKVFEF